MKITAEPRSDQWNADDFIGGPMTFTIAGVTVGKAEQKYDIELVEGQGRSWRPPLTMLRLLIAAWGDEASDWTGRRVRLYRDESVRFGSDAVGGIRISHMSHLPGNKTFSAMLTSTRGRRARHSVEPLPDGPQAITADKAAEFEQRIASATTLDELNAVAADLKAWDLGSRRKQLQTAWSERQTAIKSQPAATPEPIDQIAAINAALAKLIGDDLTAQQDWLSAWKGEPVDSPADLSDADRSSLLAELELEAQK